MQAQKLHQFAWTLKACQVPHCGHQGDRHGAWHPTQGLQGVDHGGQTPGFDVIVQFLLQTLEAVAVFADGSDIFLQDDVLRGRGTDDCREPSQVGRAPMGPARVPAIGSEQKGFETELGVFAIAEGVFTGTGEIAHGFIFDLGDRDHGEVPGTGQPGQLYGISYGQF